MEGYLGEPKTSQTFTLATELQIYPLLKCGEISFLGGAIGGRQIGISRLLGVHTQLFSLLIFLGSMYRVTDTWAIKPDHFPTPTLLGYSLLMFSWLLEHQLSRTSALQDVVVAVAPCTVLMGWEMHKGMRVLFSPFPKLSLVRKWWHSLLAK